MVLLLKKMIIKVLNYSGYNLTKKKHSEPIDLRKSSNAPRALPYYSRIDRQILIEVSFEKGRGLEIFSLFNDSYHPFIVATKFALASNDYKKALKDKLSQYYNLVQPQNASSWLGFDDGEVPELDNQPAWLTLLPWENLSIEQKMNGRIDCAKFDNKEHGSRLAIDQGWRNFGPVSQKILDIEVDRLYKLIQSVKKNGIMRKNTESGDIGAIVLMKEDNSYCWVVEWGGQHRAAVISAMGYKCVPIRVWQIVERKDAHLWPNVQSGLYSIESALKIFEKIFSGIPSSKVTLPWEVNEK